MPKPEPKNVQKLIAAQKQKTVKVPNATLAKRFKVRPAVPQKPQPRGKPSHVLALIERALKRRG